MELKLKCVQDSVPFGCSRGGLVSLLIRVVSRSQYLAVVGLRSPLPCWLSAEGRSQLLEAACVPLLVSRAASHYL